MSFDGFSIRLRTIIDSGKYTQKEAAEKIGISEHSFTKYLNGRIPQAEILYKIALLYDVSMEWLLTGKEKTSNELQWISELNEDDKEDLEIFIEFMRLRREKKKSTNTPINFSTLSDDEPPIAATKEGSVIYLPILGDAAAGIPIEIMEMKQGEVPVSNKHSKYNAFVVRAKGDSMIEDGINDGSLVVVRPQPTVENGEIALVNIAGEATIKHFYLHSPGFCELRSSNTAYPPMIYSLEDVSILGKIVEIVKKN